MSNDSVMKMLSLEEIERVTGSGPDFSEVSSSINTTAWVVETHSRGGGGGWNGLVKNIFFMNAIFRSSTRQ